MDRGDTCDIFCYDEHKVNRVKEKLSKNDFQDMAQVNPSTR